MKSRPATEQIGVSDMRAIAVYNLYPKCLDFFLKGTMLHVLSPVNPGVRAYIPCISGIIQRDANELPIGPPTGFQISKEVNWACGRRIGEGVPTTLKEYIDELRPRYIERYGIDILFGRFASILDPLVIQCGDIVITDIKKR